MQHVQKQVDSRLWASLQFNRARLENIGSNISQPIDGSPQLYPSLPGAEGASLAAARRADSPCSLKSNLHEWINLPLNRANVQTSFHKFRCIRDAVRFMQTLSLLGERVYLFLWLFAISSG
jgi:hypothetical protein